jgi:hypothetical protein
LKERKVIHVILSSSLRFFLRVSSHFVFLLTFDFSHSPFLEAGFDSVSVDRSAQQSSLLQHKIGRSLARSLWLLRNTFLLLLADMFLWSVV